MRSIEASEGSGSFFSLTKLHALKEPMTPGVGKKMKLLTKMAGFSLN